MKLNIYQVDSFASKPFTGNPAGVCITEKALDESMMLAIAQEMAVSETAFLSLDGNVLKWFTPETEVKLCGHGTLATAHIMKELGMLQVGESCTFNTLSGPLRVEIAEHDIQMDFPAPALDYECEYDKSLLTALSLSGDQVNHIVRFEEKLIIEVEEAALRALAPDFSALLKCEGRGIAVTSRSVSPELDYIARYFAPWVGINEDPVTGSAHCGLSVYWKNQTGQTRLNAYQASQRGGQLQLEVLPTNRLKIVGTAITTLEGVMSC
ncbi:PhzF family phenazine biosynthesis protein [Vibrio sp. S4M6]|uniref:PhzF family phenazine biosynthesis protein n=1 Tax=Vibrio sinus TaxID=2946865 RepID=UPI002029B755|nr:PhzF family phenazine biosynthesis protein [Vibrio sinus]